MDPMKGRTPPPPHSSSPHNPSSSPSQIACSPTSFPSPQPPSMQNSILASPPHNSSFRQQTPSISVHEALGLEEEDGHETETDTDTEIQTGSNGHMDYIMTPSPTPSSRDIGRLSVPPSSSIGNAHTRSFVRSTGAPSPSPNAYPMYASSFCGASDDGEETYKFSHKGDGSDESDGAVDGIRGICYDLNMFEKVYGDYINRFDGVDMIRLKKSQIRKLEEEVKYLEKVCEMAEKKKKNGVSIN
ncbi:hypothetical protein AOL_s00110g305 [Orbilia oligospora ATCC 24927]|uniref:Uncharacterized protein n=1 Tax=Arthrobotrys oligospora (strain ATCC 24927 / CBS 115.81 / DSM 1491) TaxID=756982 RepID=G1XLD5_ARTOA|nr:hypothetical protein AOL_s00110g305 [Orbilia oligospora ATCC 24927]EGX46141.1 hypothetical protein AOL_s00110g305 [Orbilia oligospora ATCC 24927]